MLNGALGGRAAFDVFANSEYILDQEEHARNYIPHQALRAETDRQPEYAGTRQQRRDLDAERPQRREREYQQKGDAERSAQQWQQGEEPRAFRRRRVWIERGQLPQAAVDREADCDPAEVDDKGENDRVG